MSADIQLIKKRQEYNLITQYGHMALVVGSMTILLGQTLILSLPVGDPSEKDFHLLIKGGFGLVGLGVLYTIIGTLASIALEKEEIMARWHNRMKYFYELVNVKITL